METQKNKLGAVGLILGIVGIILSFAVVGGVIGIIGFVLSIVALAKKGAKKGAAIAGFVLNLLAIIIMIAIVAAGASILSSGGEIKNDAQIENGSFSSQLEGNSENENDPNEESQQEEILPEEQEESEHTAEKPETPEISVEEFKASCQEFNYKSIARNPDEYVGQNFVVDVQVWSSANGKLFSGVDKYYKAYTNDEYDMWSGNLLYIIESQDENSESYVKVLDNDIIRVYGTFNGMVETENALTNETGEEVALNMIYCELLEE